MSEWVIDEPFVEYLIISQFDIHGWLGNHGKDKTRVPLDKLIEGLKTRGITAFAAVGYCLGGRYVFDLAFDGAIKAAAVAHPSLLEVPSDFESFKTTGIPLLINSCETDPMFPAEKQKASDEILGGGQPEAENYKRAYFPKCEHGFANRGDLRIPEVKAGKEGAFKNTVEWFLEYL